MPPPAAQTRTTGVSDGRPSRRCARASRIDAGRTSSGQGSSRSRWSRPVTSNAAMGTASITRSSGEAEPVQEERQPGEQGARERGQDHHVRDGGHAERRLARREEEADEGHPGEDQEEAGREHVERREAATVLVDVALGERGGSAQPARLPRAEPIVDPPREQQEPEPRNQPPSPTAARQRSGPCVARCFRTYREIAGANRRPKPISVSRRSSDASGQSRSRNRRPPRNRVTNALNAMTRPHSMAQADATSCSCQDSVTKRFPRVSEPSSPIVIQIGSPTSPRQASSVTLRSTSSRTQRPQRTIAKNDSSASGTRVQVIASLRAARGSGRAHARHTSSRHRPATALPARAQARLLRARRGAHAGSRRPTRRTSPANVAMGPSGRWDGPRPRAPEPAEDPDADSATASPRKPRLQRALDTLERVGQQAAGPRRSVRDRAGGYVGALEAVLGRRVQRGQPVDWRADPHRRPVDRAGDGELPGRHGHDLHRVPSAGGGAGRGCSASAWPRRRGSSTPASRACSRSRPGCC